MSLQLGDDLHTLIVPNTELVLRKPVRGNELFSIIAPQNRANLAININTFDKFILHRIPEFHSFIRGSSS
jgi:hypothetical protein